MSSISKIAQLEAEILGQHKTRLKAIQSLCESEIEKLFVLNVINYYESQLACEVNYIFEPPDFDLASNAVSYKNKVQVNNRFGDTVFPIGLKVSTPYFDFDMLPQYELSIRDKSYRLDFYLKITRWHDKKIFNLCVECDGFEFHGRTLEQVNRDNQRQIDLNTNGFTVFRYSGSEIYKRSSFDAFKEVIKQMMDLIGVNGGYLM